ncbi:Dimethyl-sulfide monooxygenase [Methylobacterium cerastii]|uniref:Dimethyl-sulfide monooxygenase n=1 Tax=Methylobacterium cerastii TaxID=932741 RepID=A0ABQ4QL75_9HYPH|nr:MULTISPECIES: LLM class flavin-dependent oxidoreductase [Methylobacterium]TXN79564.1 LLM class flavin-dependent oxidoreductase [Methylobacterium sp. WL8]GJD45501.1 Dimethyl-sulfide monooxygenase [Methylobacterium cerastii]
MTGAAKQIRLNAFNMNCVGHINHGLWTHPRDRSAEYNTLRYWTDQAKLLERGLFDGMFIADILGVYDIYGGGIGVTAREAVQLPVNDPTLIVPAMAAVTEHLGFGITLNVFAEAPYTFARRLSTLDHLTGGRVGWNVVTGYLESAHRGRGEALPAHDRRYDYADEYLEVLYKLWEGSWDDAAVRRDREARVFSDPALIRPVSHRGEFLSVDGYHLCEPSPQRTPVLYQAGASGRGRAFAGRHAECVFISARDKDSAREAVRAIRAEAAAAGRDPQDVKVFIGIAAIPGRTRAEAEDKRAEYMRYASAEAGLAHFSASTGIDFSRYGLDEPISYAPGNAIQSATAAAAKRGLTKRDLLSEMGLGGRYAVLTGDAVAIADELQSWVEEGEVDGFNLSRIVVPESFSDFIDVVIPELQDRGLYKTGYAPGSFRNKLFGQGDRLPARHAAQAYRSAAAVTG